jgi:hypothetical protein
MSETKHISAGADVADIEGVDEIGMLIQRQHLKRQPRQISNRSQKQLPESANGLAHGVNQPFAQIVAYLTVWVTCWPSLSISAFVVIWSLGQERTVFGISLIDWPGVTKIKHPKLFRRSRWQDESDIARGSSRASGL